MSVVGVDLGGTKIAAAVVSRDGEAGPMFSIPTPAAAGPVAVLDAVTRLVMTAAASMPIRAIGIGTAGVVDVERGVIISATATLPGWPGTDVAAGIRDRLVAAGWEPPVIAVTNDVDAHAIGEGWCGAGAGADSLLMVAVGTGVGGAVLFNERPLRGAHHLAGEIGHLPVPGVGDLVCPCGRPGHLEALAAGPAIHRRYLALGGDPASQDARDVAVRASAGEPLARQVLTTAATAVGRGIAGIVTVLDPEVVIVGGGVAEAGTLWWAAMERAIRAEVIDVLASLPVLRAALGNQAAIIGAARDAWLKLAGEGR